VDFKKPEWKSILDTTQFFLKVAGFDAPSGGGVYTPLDKIRYMGVEAVKYGKQDRKKLCNGATVSI